MMIDLRPIAPYLREHIAAQLTDAVATLEMSIAGGTVRNVDFVKSKEAINRAVDQAFDALNDKIKNWHFESLVMGAWCIKSALREAIRDGVAPRIELLTAMSPLNDLLQSAKPLIVKRQPSSAPEPDVKPAGFMSCQVCGRAIAANTGVIARHGFRRPGGGSQTQSCLGANAAPYEESRERLARLISINRADAAEIASEIADAEAGLKPITLRVPDPSRPRSLYGGRATKLITLSRDSAAEILADVDWDGGTPIATFDAAMSIWLSRRKSAMDGFNYEAGLLQHRFDAWKKTHQWDAKTEGWAPIGDAAAVDKAPQ